MQNQRARRVRAAQAAREFAQRTLSGTGNKFKWACRRTTSSVRAQRDQRPRRTMELQAVLALIAGRSVVELRRLQRARSLTTSNILSSAGRDRPGTDTEFMSARSLLLFSSLRRAAALLLREAESAGRRRDCRGWRSWRSRSRSGAGRGGGAGPAVVEALALAPAGSGAASRYR